MGYYSTSCFIHCMGHSRNIYRMAQTEQHTVFGIVRIAPIGSAVSPSMHHYILNKNVYTLTSPHSNLG